MQQVVGRIEIEHQLRGRTRERGDEVLHHRLVHRPGDDGPSSQRSAASNRLIASAQRLNERVPAQPVVIVQVLIAQTQPEHPLPEHARHIVPHLARRSRIDQPRCHPIQQPEATIHFTQQQRPAIAGDLTATEFGLHRAPTQRRKVKPIACTICHWRNLPLLRSKPLNSKGFGGFAAYLSCNIRARADAAGFPRSCLHNFLPISRFQCLDGYAVSACVSRGCLLQ